MKRWISIGQNIIDPDFFSIFYIENIPSGEWVIFGEDKNQVCWRLMKFQFLMEAENNLLNIYNQIRD